MSQVSKQKDGKVIHSSHLISSLLTEPLGFPLEEAILRLRHSSTMLWNVRPPDFGTYQKKGTSVVLRGSQTLVITSVHAGRTFVSDLSYSKFACKLRISRSADDDPLPEYTIALAMTARAQPPMMRRCMMDLSKVMVDDNMDLLMDSQERCFDFLSFAERVLCSRFDSHYV
jgi:hypothetical protein